MEIPPRNWIQCQTLVLPSAGAVSLLPLLRSNWILLPLQRLWPGEARDWLRIKQAVRYGEEERRQGRRKHLPIERVIHALVNYRWTKGVLELRCYVVNGEFQVNKWV
ncbi:unnamed protein product [Linum trigynum]|uniref:Uncharacterized protein n=1 Tax=Linum trigynum TaxID=586398 RepID=A0AAV2FAQ2_9ROSI